MTTNERPGDLRSEFAALRADIKRLERRLSISGLAALITTLTLLFAALHLWPPHAP